MIRFYTEGTRFAIPTEHDFPTRILDIVDAIGR